MQLKNALQKLLYTSETLWGSLEGGTKGYRAAQMAHLLLVLQVQSEYRLLLAKAHLFLVDRIQNTIFVSDLNTSLELELTSQS